MVDQKLVALVNKLYRSTGAGKVKWTQTAISDAYKAEFAGYVLEITKESRSGGDLYIIRIYNETGDLIEEFSDEDIDAPTRVVSEDLIYYRLMREMHEVATRTALENKPK